MLFTTNQNRQNVVENISTLIYSHYCSRKSIKKSFSSIPKVYRSTITIVNITSNNNMIDNIDRT